ncbi:MAG: amidohydrolase family protein [Chloroflexota bacterium]|nr:amidohydrolase family protein [Chloroflexota bacterium]
MSERLGGGPQAVSALVERVKASVAELPAVDQHCHTLVAGWSLMGDSGAPGWRRCFTEAGRPASLAGDVGASRGYREFLRALAHLLGESSGQPAELEARVVRRRALAIGGEPDAYARRLFDDARISTLLVDTGFGSQGLTPTALARTVGRPVRTIVRIEKVAEGCLAGAQGRSLTRLKFTETLLEELDRALSAGAIGFKSIAAYRAGLDLPEPSASQVAGAFRRSDQEGQARRLDDPVLVAHVVWTAARLAAGRGVPLQLHVGFGDEDVHLPGVDPALLRALFRAPSTEGCPIILLHCYPFVDQAAYLASVYPQVHVDLSLTIPLVGGAGAERAIRSALALCPTTKLLAASDGHSYPEMHWRGMSLWRSALANVLAKEVAAGRMDENEVEPSARGILAENSERVFRLAAS